jgi:cyclopropane fatty-acyl-phospholipid synthase-like methyltransferase
MNTEKSTAVIFTRRRLKLFEQEIARSTEAKHLGMHLERSLKTWKAQMKAKENKALQRFVLIYSIFK